MNKNLHNLTPKHITTHKNLYYDLWYKQNNYFQYDLYWYKFAKPNSNLLITHPEVRTTLISWEDIHDEWFILRTYDHLTELSFHQFFFTNQIDIPVCFRKSISLLRRQRELIILRFITYFMRHGLKLKTLVGVLSSIQHLSWKILSYKNSIPSWKVIFLTFQNTTYTMGITN